MRRLGLALAAVACLTSVAAADRAALRVELGRRLFYDADLSINGTMSCATCHEQKHGFTDNNRSHPGALGHPGKRNVPGLANVGAFHNLTFADNSLGSLERQARNPILGTSPLEMAVAGHEAEVVARFATDGCYPKLFAAAFPDRRGEVSLATIAQALAAFERTLVSLDSPYDRGAPRDAAAETGARLFAQAGCADCHKPPYFTDDDFHRVRLLGPDETDGGLADVTGKAADRGMFRTTPLRNVGVTFPYWHDGRAATLADAIALHGSGTTPQETTALVAFLQTLTDERFLKDERFSLPPAACPAP